MTVWRLKKGADRRIRQGHPWVFASEIGHSTKEVRPGDVVELQDHQNHFLAYGYAHPSSQICFRRLSSRAQDKDVLSERFFRERLQRARQLRIDAGWASASHRWLFAENDGVPGLVVDAFLSGLQWLVVVQASTAGIERALPAVIAALLSFADEMGPISLIEAPSSKSRALEGLPVRERKVLQSHVQGLERLPIRLRHGLELRADFLGGQKTGFFLDQQANASALRELVTAQFKGRSEPIKVLDICCYVGQWAARVAHALDPGATDVTLFDTSAAALELAEANVRAQRAAAVATVEGDAMKDLARLIDGTFDVVICDPPAFVKKRADLPTGLAAYTKLNREAMRLVRPGGLLVASSCSGLVKTADWQEVLCQASQKAGRVFQQLVQGGHAPDHPLRPEFPEGEYLKCVIGRIDYPY